MPEYALYLESGPKRRKTMVHVLGLLGCIAQGPTTEAALDAAPGAIRTYLRFLKRHGDAVEPAGAFTTAVAAHVTEGAWLGNGDPTPGFVPDFEPLPASELAVLLRRLEWLGADLAEIAGGIAPGALNSRPATGRSALAILEHVAEAQGTYLRYTVGKVDNLREALNAVHEGDGLERALVRLWEVTIDRLDAIPEIERQRLIPHGQVTWTARRGLRRMLEHGWEHLQELSAR